MKYKTEFGQLNSNKSTGKVFARDLKCCHVLGMFMATFSRRRSLIFLVNVLKRGWPGNIASSGKNKLLEAPALGVGWVGGSVKSGAPILQRK